MSVLKIDATQLTALRTVFSGVAPREVDRAKKTALGRTRRGMKQRVSTLIRTRGEKKYTVPATRAKKGVHLSRIANDQFTVTASPARISYTYFRAAPKKVGISIKVFDKKGKETIKSAFFGRGKKGGRQVFRRAFLSGHSGEQVDRYKLDTLKGPAIASMVELNEWEDDLAEYLNERFDSELVASIKNIVRKRK